MRKLFSLLLALCLMCTAWTPAFAWTYENAAVGYPIEFPDFLPRDSMEIVCDEADSFQAVWYVGTLSVAGQELNETFVIIQSNPYSISKYADTDEPGAVPYCEYSLSVDPDGKPTHYDWTYIHTTETNSQVVQISCKAFADESADHFDVMNSFIADLYKQYVKKIISVITGMSSSSGEVTLAETIQIGRGSLQVPGGMMVLASNDYKVTLLNDDAYLDMYIVDWADLAGLSVADLNNLSSGPLGLDNTFALLYFFVAGSNTQVAGNLADAFSVVDWGLPGEGTTMTCVTDTNAVLCTYYFDHIGVLIVAAPPEGSDGLILPDLAAAVTASFRADGMSLDEMFVYEEEAAARAAEQAAMQKYVVVVNDTAKVRTEPDISSGLIKTVNKGEVFPMNGESGDFYSIQIDGRTGYIHKTTCAIQ